MSPPIPGLLSTAGTGSTSSVAQNLRLDEPLERQMGQALSCGYMAGNLDHVQKARQRVVVTGWRQAWSD